MAGILVIQVLEVISKVKKIEDHFLKETRFDGLAVGDAQRGFRLV